MTALTNEEFYASCEIVAASDPRLLDQSHCWICITDFTEDSTLVIREIEDCRHIFHGECLRRWLTESDACPVCCGPAQGVLTITAPLRRSWNLMRID